MSHVSRAVCLVCQDIVYRDLKPENIFWREDGQLVLADFGLAKRLWTEHASKDVSLSVQGTILGTGRAMSPEQVLGEEVDHRSDLFSFGTLLYEMVSGERPFMGSSLVLTMAQVCSEEHRSLSVVRPDLPSELVAVVDRLPKTRSGKILRGTMKKIADSEEYKVPATIDDPAILDEITAALKSIGYAKG